MKKNNSSIYSLVFVNLITIIFAVHGQWSFGVIVSIYWAQSVIIGFFQFLKIMDLKKFSTKNFTFNNKSVEPTVKTKKDTARFFALHYGVFHAVYLIFIGAEFYDGIWIPVVVSAILFFINHLFSYITNKNIDQKRVPNIGKMMFFPYVRILPMHLIIVFGGGFLDGVFMLVIFLLLKTTADVVTHMIEHGRGVRVS